MRPAILAIRGYVRSAERGGQMMETMTRNASVLREGPNFGEGPR